MKRPSVKAKSTHTGSSCLTSELPHNLTPEFYHTSNTQSWLQYECRVSGSLALIEVSRERKHVSSVKLESVVKIPAGVTGGQEKWWDVVQGAENSLIH